jgi:hypothetical protein
MVLIHFIFVNSNLLEMYPSFPCQKRGHKRAYFLVPRDCCYDSIQQDYLLGTFSAANRIHTHT